VTGPVLLHEILDAAAAAHQGTPAVRMDDDRVTYCLMREQSVRIAAWLRATGVDRGDRVLIALPVSAMLPSLIFACSRVGAVFVVTGDRTPAVLAGHLLSDAGPALVLSDSPELHTLAGRLGIAHRGSADIRVAAAAPASAPPPPGPIPVDPVCFIYTSGSTAMPKAVVCTHERVIFAALAIQSQLRYLATDIVYCPLPMSFDYGLYQVFLCALAGAELCLATAQAAGPRLLVELAEYGVSVLPAVPSLAGQLASLLRRRRTRLPALRLLTSTGAAMPARVLADLRVQLPQLRVQLMYGLTECKRATVMPPDEDLRRPGACGRALPGTEVFAADGEGRRLPAGQVGELVVRGPNVMAGYWRRAELTAQRFRRVHGLFPQLHTGDYGWLDEDGFLYFAGRRDDIYKERGFRVSTVEVEAAACRVPGVSAAVVVPPADGEDGATLLVESRLRPHEVLVGLRSQLDETRVPARCVIVSKLPLNANGKVERTEVARLAAVDSARPAQGGDLGD
jgi:acyl-CoA synthetase (AMP-forming)/AMP-acid ligase II